MGLTLQDVTATLPVPTSIDRVSLSPDDDSAGRFTLDNDQASSSATADTLAADAQPDDQPADDDLDAEQNAAGDLDQDDWRSARAFFALDSQPVPDLPSIEADTMSATLVPSAVLAPLSSLAAMQDNRTTTPDASVSTDFTAELAQLLAPWLDGSQSTPIPALSVNSAPVDSASTDSTLPSSVALVPTAVSSAMTSVMSVLSPGSSLDSVLNSVLHGSAWPIVDSTHRPSGEQPATTSAAVTSTASAALVTSIATAVPSLPWLASAMQSVLPAQTGSGSLANTVLSSQLASNAGITNSAAQMSAAQMPAPVSLAATTTMLDAAQDSAQASASINVNSTSTDSALSALTGSTSRTQSAAQAADTSVLAGALNDAFSLNGAFSLNSALTASYQTAGSALKLDSDQQNWSQQLVSTLGDRVRMQADSQQQTATIRLDPPQLGRLEVSVQQEGDRLSVQIHTSSATLRDALQESREQLRQVLIPQYGAGVEVEINYRQDGQNAAAWQQEEEAVSRNATAGNTADSSADSSRQTAPQGWLDTLV